MVDMNERKKNIIIVLELCLLNSGLFRVRAGMSVLRNSHNKSKRLYLMEATHRE